jgi:hypothetical protein
LDDRSTYRDRYGDGDTGVDMVAVGVCVWLGQLGVFGVPDFDGPVDGEIAVFEFRMVTCLAGKAGVIENVSLKMTISN